MFALWNDNFELRYLLELPIAFNNTVSTISSGNLFHRLIDSFESLFGEHDLLNSIGLKRITSSSTTFSSSVMLTVVNCI